jgi:heptosyltransferase II
MNARAPKVLLIRLSSLGDVVLSTAAIAPLRAAGFSVSFATKTEFASLLLGQPHLDKVYAFNKRERGEKQAREAFLSWAKGEGFDLVIDLQNSWRTWGWRGSLRRMAPVFALPKPRLREWLVIFLRLGRWFGFRPGGRAARFRDAAEKGVKLLGGQVGALQEPLTSLQSLESEKESVRSLLPRGSFVALLPASAWRSKEWPYFPELARRLAAQAPVVVLGGAKDEICERVARAAREVNPESRSLHGKTTIRESMAVLAHARWVIGNDTGMVHVAEALGKSVAMVEGPTHFYMGFSPYRESSVLLGREDLACRPCSKSGRVCVRFGTRACLYGLNESEVALQLRERGFPC